MTPLPACSVTRRTLRGSISDVGAVVSRQSHLTLPENVMMLKRESLSEAFVSRVWISMRFTDPRAALMLSELSTTKVMLHLCLPKNCGISAASEATVCLDVIPVLQ